MPRRINRIPRYFQLIISVSLLIVVVFFGCGKSNNRNNGITEVSIRFPIPVMDAGLAPYYVGIEKGIFKKYGLKLKTEPGTPELNPIKMVAQGVDEFGLVGGPELLITGRNMGANIKGIMLIHKNSDFVTLLTLKKSGITKLAQLNGKRVGFFYGHISTDILHMLFKKEKINVKEIDVGFDYSQLITGKIEAEWAFTTTAGINLPSKGVEINFISPSEYGIHTQGHVIVTSEKLIKEKPEIVQNFISAMIEAVKYTADHTNESINIILKYDPNFDRTIAIKQFEIYNKIFSTDPKLGWISPMTIKSIKAQMVSVGLIKADYDVQSAFKMDFVDQYYKKITH